MSGSQVHRLAAVGTSPVSPPAPTCTIVLLVRRLFGRASGQQREGRDVAGADDVEVTMVKRRHLRDTESFGDCDYGGIGRAERKVGICVDQFCHALVVGDFEVDDSERPLGNRAKECALDLRSTGTGEEVADLGHNGCGDEDRATREVQAREQVRAGTVVSVASIRRGHERTGIADDHSGAPEAVGEQIVMIATEIGPSALERPEPSRGPLAGWLELDLASYLREDGRHPVVGQLLDQLLQLIALGAHTAQSTEGATQLVAGARRYRHQWLTNETTDREARRYAPGAQALISARGAGLIECS
jgi:hypothetical protein